MNELNQRIFDTEKERMSQSIERALSKALLKELIQQSNSKIIKEAFDTIFKKMMCTFDTASHMYIGTDIVEELKEGLFELWNEEFQKLKDNTLKTYTNNG